jgi:2-amino-4-hydroxy-6-hydroxymethyldihydropteridine diphosphokinase
MIHALVAFGANLPFGERDAAETILAAKAALLAEGIDIVQMSPIYSTPCFPAGAGPDYANAVAEVNATSCFSEQDLLSALHRIEARFGRERSGRWAGRTLDLDLLACNGNVLPDAATAGRWMTLPPESQARMAPDQLILPHPRMQDRAFVLVPMADVAPDWRHPLLGLTVREMLERLPRSDREAVKPL